MNEFPEPASDETVARIVSSMGSELFTVEIPLESPGSAGIAIPQGGRLPLTIARMPARFMNLIFVRQGSLVIVKAATEAIQSSSARYAST